jgi:methionyl aminopeptidase
LIELLTPDQRDKLRRACRSAAETLAVVAAAARPGVTTADLDRLAREDIQRRGSAPSLLGYQGFPASVCTSLNDVVCHGVPSDDDVIRPGDLLNIDVTSHQRGFHGDTNVTLLFGDVSPEARHVTDVARRCTEAGIAAVRPGAHLGDIGDAIQTLARLEGCSVVHEFGGHGIGRHIHMDPHVPHMGETGAGLQIVPGMAFTVEPMINLGRPETRTDADGWTVRTRDGSLSAQFEHTLLVTEEGVEVLTRL